MTPPLDPNRSSTHCTCAERRARQLSREQVALSLAIQRDSELTDAEFDAAASAATEMAQMTPWIRRGPTP